MSAFRAMATSSAREYPVSSCMVDILARPAGFEPTTPGLGILCSILLSYGRFSGSHCVGRIAAHSRRRSDTCISASRKRLCSHHGRLPAVVDPSATYMGPRSGSRNTLRTAVDGFPLRRFHASGSKTICTRSGAQRATLNSMGVPLASTLMPSVTRTGLVAGCCRRRASAAVAVRAVTRVILRV